MISCKKSEKRVKTLETVEKDSLKSFGKKEEDLKEFTFHDCLMVRKKQKYKFTGYHVFLIILMSIAVFGFVKNLNLAIIMGISGVFLISFFRSEVESIFK